LLKNSFKSVHRSRDTITLQLKQCFVVIVVIIVAAVVSFILAS